jgi:hypothetical protein
VLNLEKRYTRNQELRIKYAGQPDKYDLPPHLLPHAPLGAQTPWHIPYVRPRDNKGSWSRRLTST